MGLEEAKIGGVGGAETSAPEAVSDPASDLVPDPVPDPVPEAPPEAPPEPAAGTRRRSRARRVGSGLGARLFLVLLAFGLIYGAFSLTGKSIPLPVWAVVEVENRLNHALEGALPEGALSVGGISVQIGKAWVPSLMLEDLRLLQPGGKTLLILPQTHVTFDPAALMTGRLRAQSLLVTGARIALRRDRDGRFDLMLGSGQGPQIDSLAALFEAADRAFALPALAQLRKIEAEALTLSLSDARAGRTYEVGDGRLTLENRDTELAAELGLSLVGGGSAPAQALLTVVAAKGAGTARITATVNQVAAADLAAQTVLLEWLEVLDAPISGRIAATLGPAGVTALEGRLDIGKGALRPAPDTSPIAFDRVGMALGLDPATGRILLGDLVVESASLRLKASGQSYMVDAAGKPMTGALSERRPAAFLGQIAFSDVRVDPEGLFQAPVQFSEGALDLRLRLNPFVLDIGQLTLVQGGQRLGLSGQLAAESGGWRTALDITLNEVTLDRLLALWPVTLVPNTRAWLGANVLTGALSDVRGAIRIAPGAEPILHLGYDFTGADVRFMASLPPVTGADGYSTIDGSVFTQVMTRGIVTPPQGGVIDVSGTVFAVPDIRAKPAQAEMVLRTQSSLTATLSLLDQKPFHFLTKAGQPVDLGEGTAQMETRLTMPLQKKITFEEVDYTVQGTIHDFRSGVLVKDHVITAPVLALTATPTGMQVAGPGLIGKVPFDVTYDQGFGEGLEDGRINGTVRLSQVAVDEFGIGLPRGMVRGEAAGTLAIDLPRGGVPRLRLTSELRGVTLAIPELGWVKAASARGGLEVEVRLGTPAVVERLSLSGGGLEATGKVTFTAAGGLELARFDRVRLSGWLDAAVEIKGRGPSRAVALAVTGGSVILGKMPEQRGASGGGSAGSPLTLRLDRMNVSDGIDLTDFRGNFSLAGGFNGDFTALVNGEAPITGAVAPARDGTAVRIQAINAGKVMKAAGMFSSAKGGALDLTLIPRKTPGYYDGRADITDIRVRNASVLADLLNAISVVGILEQLNGSGIVFNKADADFLLTPNAVQVTRAAAVGASLGVSMAGIYEMGTGKLDMRGVVSPIYLINSIGAILTRRGEGLFGFNYDLRGTADAPQISVNPLSILTPGMFREIFRQPAPMLEGEGG